ncbi:MAG TPA: FmdE family protein [Pyrinomonadaceae bacterium]|nr:FmdE family protein [Pyrinomonadaceae bacterium]
MADDSSTAASTTAPRETGAGTATTHDVKSASHASGGRGLGTLDALLEECGRLHGHMCAGQLLGARMAVVGCREVGIEDPRGADRKKLVVWVEIDRCMADAVGAVTGVRLGKRSLKYFDYGKVAATFLNTETNMAVRVVALEESRALADARHLEIESKKERQFKTYREASDEELFKVERVAVEYKETDAPGRPLSRVRCARCGEGVNDGREVRGGDGLTLCRPCASGGYYRRL